MRHSCDWCDKPIAEVGKLMMVFYRKGTRSRQHVCAGCLPEVKRKKLQESAFNL